MTMSVMRPMAAGAAAIMLLSAAAHLPDGGAGIPRAGEPGASYLDTVALNPVEIGGNPYREKGDDRRLSPTAVCAVGFIDSSGTRYVLGTFDSPRDAAAAGFRVTHHGACGACSTLQDLDVYLRNPDLTRAARKCAFRMTGRGITACLEGLGMSPPCARIWYYNIRNTARHCLGTCLLSWLKREPYNNADGSLNRCIRCDEEKSGPVFKKYAGRTRRNSGIESEIIRGNDEVLPVGHGYR